MAIRTIITLGADDVALAVETDPTNTLIIALRGRNNTDRPARFTFVGPMGEEHSVRVAAGVLNGRRILTNPVSIDFATEAIQAGAQFGLAWPVP